MSSINLRTELRRVYRSHSHLYGHHALTPTRTHTNAKPLHARVRTSCPARPPGVHHWASKDYFIPLAERVPAGQSQDLLEAPGSSNLPSVPKKGPDNYEKAKEYAAKLKSGETFASQCEEFTGGQNSGYSNVS